MDFNPNIPDPRDKIKNEIKNELIPLQKEAVRINNKGRVVDPKASQDKFFEVFDNELRNIRKCDKILKKISEYLFTDEVIAEMDEKMLLESFKAVAKYKESSRDYTLKMYSEAARNELLRKHLEDKKKGNNKIDLDNPEELKKIIYKIREKINQKTVEDSEKKKDDGSK